MPAKDVSAKLLAWYDGHARDLPWRVRDGRADPYRVWLSEVMLQQTTVATVRPRFEAWVARWPSVEALAGADEADVMAAWAGLGYYARARNLMAAARAVVERGGFPRTQAELRRLPGLGDYTAAAVAAIAFGEAAPVVDTNVERVVARLCLIDRPLPGARPAIRRAAAALVPADRPGDMAQATMDLGATLCTPKRPRCLLCPLRDECRAFAEGEPERLPVKPVRGVRPVRHGTIFWLQRDVGPEHLPGESRGPVPSAGPGPGFCRGSAEVLLVRRPARGLLGGMRALPTGPWQDTPPGLADAPAPADWLLLPATVRHGFTHFELHLALAVAPAPAHGATDGEWWPVARLGEAGLPTVFATAARAMVEAVA